MIKDLLPQGRLLELMKYNRDWLKYLFSRYRRPQPGGTIDFRLRNGQVIRLFSDGRFVLNEIYLERVYDIPGLDLTKCDAILDIGANAGVFALYAASRSPRATIY